MTREMSLSLLVVFAYWSWLCFLGSALDWTSSELQPVADGSRSIGERTCGGINNNIT